MKRLAIFIAIAFISSHPFSLFGQTVCQTGDCRLDCEKESAPANLFIAESVRLRGVVLDKSGTPYEQAAVQIRDFQTHTVLFTAQADRTGRFKIASIPAGKFRLIAIWTKNGEVKRLPLADQPENIVCLGPAECSVKIMLHFHGTDNPFDFCPPR